MDCCRWRLVFSWHSILHTRKTGTSFVCSWFFFSLSRFSSMIVRFTNSIHVYFCGWSILHYFSVLISFMSDKSCQFEILTQGNLFMQHHHHQGQSFQLELGPVGWGCWIHRLHLERSVRLPQCVSWIWH